MADGFRGFSPWSLGHWFWACDEVEHQDGTCVVEQSFSPHGGQEVTDGKGQEHSQTSGSIPKEPASSTASQCLSQWINPSRRSRLLIYTQPTTLFSLSLSLVHPPWV